MPPAPISRATRRAQGQRVAISTAGSARATTRPGPRPVFAESRQKYIPFRISAARGQSAAGGRSPPRQPGQSLSPSWEWG